MGSAFASASALAATASTVSSVNLTVDDLYCFGTYISVQAFVCLFGFIGFFAVIGFVFDLIIGLFKYFKNRIKSKKCKVNENE